jgi:hypothetical protein
MSIKTRQDLRLEVKKALEEQGSLNYNGAEDAWYFGVTWPNLTTGTTYTTKHAYPNIPDLENSGDFDEPDEEDFKSTEDYDWAKQIWENRLALEYEGICNSVDVWSGRAFEECVDELVAQIADDITEKGRFSAVISKTNTGLAADGELISGTAVLEYGWIYMICEGELTGDEWSLSKPTEAVCLEAAIRGAFEDSWFISDIKVKSAELVQSPDTLEARCKEASQAVDGLNRHEAPDFAHNGR